MSHNTRRNILDGITWDVNDYNGITGAVIINAKAIHTSFFDISDYAGEAIVLLLSGFTIGIDAQKILFYDENFAFTSGIYVSTDMITARVPSNAKYAIISLSYGGVNDGYISIDGFALLTNAADVSSDFNGNSYYDINSGNLKNDSSFCCYLLKINTDRVSAIGIVSGVYFDAGMKFVGNIPYSNTPNVVAYATVPDSACFLGLNTTVAYKDKVMLNDMKTADFMWYGTP